MNEPSDSEENEAHINHNFDLSHLRSRHGFPLHEDGSRTWFAGWAFEDGVAAFGLRTNENRSEYYEHATQYSSMRDHYLGAYMEFPLSDAEFDIVSNVLRSHDPLALYRSIREHAGDDIQIPDEHLYDWERIEKFLSYSNSGESLRNFLSKEYLAPSIFPSEKLATWCRDLVFGPLIFGEIFFRFVCYRGHLPSGLSELLERDENRELRSGFSSYLEKEAKKTVFDMEPITESQAKKYLPDTSPEIVEYFNERLDGFQKADGMIPLWLEGTDEALIVPFSFKPLWWGEEPGFYEGGKEPRNLLAWQKELVPIRATLNLSPELSKICLSLPLGPFLDKVHGKSLHLPIKLAAEALFDIASPKKRSYLATGEIRGDKLEGVCGIGAKSRLAKWMGLTFIGQESGESENCILFTPGDYPSNLIEKWKTELGADLNSMSPEESYKQLGEYESSIIRRSLPTGDKSVIDNIKAISGNLEKDPFLSGELWRAKVCIANQLNHMGEAEKALPYLDKALIEAGESPSELLVATLANCVVAKVDVGYLEEAEAYGRKARRKAEELTASEPKNRLRAYLESAGSLGAQTLLAQGLWSEEKRKESRALLDECVANAGRLVEMVSPHNGLEKEEALSDWAHSHGQLTWWKALYEPEQCLASFDCLQDELAQKGKKIVESQFSFLLRARWHSAFRLALAGNEVGFAWDNWGLEDHVMKPFWLKALCFKYRGYLNAKNGSVERASEDYDRAVELLSDPPGKIFRVFKGSVLALRYDSLDDDPAKSSAIEEFESIRKAGFYEAHPKASPSHWLEFLKGKTSRNPQLDFVY